MTSTDSRSETASGDADIEPAGYPNLALPLERNALWRSSEVALIDGDTRLNWAKFADRVARLAGAFVAMGVTPGARVGVLAQNSFQVAECVYAAFWCGAIAYTLNNRLAVPELSAQFEENTPTIVVVHHDFIELARALPAGPKMVVVEAPSKLADAVDYEALIASATPIPRAGARNHETAMLVYTGGTTGRSKGAMLSHANLWANVYNVNTALGITSAHRYLLASPLFHVSAIARMICTITAGGSLVFLRRFTARSALSAIEEHKVAVTTLVPTMLKAVVDDPDLHRYDLSSLKIISYGAAPSDETLLRSLGRKIPHADLWQAYGMTEVSPTATQLGPDKHRDPDGRWLRSAGKPALLCEVRVANENDEPMPTGEIGEVLIRGPNVMKGYWNRPELTRRTLRGGWMHTGDLGYLDDTGYLFVVDRKDDMIISGGENIYTTEVENAVASHPKVHQCAVVGLRDEKWGQSVHVVVVPLSGENPSLEEIQQHCRQLIAGYKLPRTMELRSEPLPVSGANKVLKTAIREDVEARRAAAGRRVSDA